MYRQNAEYTIPHDADAELSVMIRHQRYVNAREHYHTVPYHDNMSVAVFKPDLQLIALRKALAKMQTANPEGYALLTNFYFENFREVICRRIWHFKAGYGKENSQISCISTCFGI